MIQKSVLSIKSIIKNRIFALIKRQATVHGNKVVSDQPTPDNDKFIENYFKKTHLKNALLSYIVYPFTGEIQNNHSNHRECFTIAQILDDLGYKVDVINWNNDTFIPAKNYDLVIDNHNNLARLKDHFKENTRKIFHATNAHWLYQNSVEYARYEAFFIKTGVAIQPPRLLAPGNSAAYSDAISMFGNDFTKNTYGEYGSKVHQLPMSVNTKPEIQSERNFTSAKKKFVWLNSHGALLKGLDIVIDAFTALPEYTLYVCGNMEREREFMEAIAPQLANAPNIIFAGWVDMDGKEFKEIAGQSAWVINTSFSEGGGGSTLNCMAKGLIPVVSYSSSITLPEKTGFYLANNNAAALADMLRGIVQLPEDELKERSLNAFHFITKQHTPENFRELYTNFLVVAISSSSQND